MKNRTQRLRIALVVTTLTLATSAQAVEVLFAHTLNLSHPYHNDGNELAGYVNSLAGYNVTIRYLDDAVYSDYASFDQVWVYDLYGGANNNATQAANYANIGAWYNGLDAAQKNLIADGRIISSAWANESAWIQNYALELMDNGRTGGLVLGTDHDYYVAGINEINATIDINPFAGNLSSQVAVVDPNSPLYTAAGVFGCGPGQQCVRDNSSPSYAPAGLQPNGQTLTPVAYHGTVSDAWANAAISSTLGSSTFGTCGNPGQPPCDNSVPEPNALGLFALGLGCAGWVRRRKAQRH